MTLANARLAGAILDALAVPVLAVTRSRRIVLANASAQSILSARDGVHVIDGKLALGHPPAGGALERALTAACDGHGASPGSRTTLLEGTRPSGRRALDVVVAAIPARDAGRSPRALVLLHDPEQENRAIEEIALRRYRLTRAELAVARNLLAGESSQGIAAALGISVHTVRTHLKRLLSKTGAGTRADLMRELLGSPIRLLG